MAGTLTWLGHAAFRIDTPGGKRVYVDPFLNGNPKCPESEKQPERVDLIAITHGHAAHAGDTCVFGDMQLIGRIYSPDVAVLPIGGYYTMDPKEAAVALELLGTKRCVPCHYGTFPPLIGTPQELKQLAPGVDVAEIQPGDSVEL